MADSCGATKTTTAKKGRCFPDEGLWPPVSTKPTDPNAPSVNACKLSDFPQVQFNENFIELSDTCGVKVPQGLAVAMIMLRSKHCEYLDMKPPHNFLLDRPPPMTETREEQVKQVAQWLLDTTRTLDESMSFLEAATPNFLLQVVLQIIKFIKPCPLPITHETCELVRTMSFFRDGNPIYKDDLEAWTYTYTEKSEDVTTPKDPCINQEYYLCTYNTETQYSALNLFNTSLFMDTEQIVNKRLRDCVCFIIANCLHIVRTYCCAVVPCFWPDCDVFAVVKAARSRTYGVRLFIQRLAEEIAPILFDLDRAWFIKLLKKRYDIIDKRPWIRKHKDSMAVHIMMNVLCTNYSRLWHSGVKLEDLLIHSTEHKDCSTEEDLVCSCVLARTLQENRIKLRDCC